MKHLFLLYLFLMVKGFAASSVLGIGDDAPNFLLKDQEGFAHDLISHRGEFVVLFFYPRDFTFPAQKKLQSMRKLVNTSTSNKFVVYGISNDTVDVHHKFYDKMHVSFDLLSDVEEKAIRAYHAKGFIETKPLVVVIGPDGRIFRTYKNMQKFLDSKGIISSIINGSI